MNREDVKSARCSLKEADGWAARMDGFLDDLESGFFAEGAAYGIPAWVEEASALLYNLRQALADIGTALGDE